MNAREQMEALLAGKVIMCEGSRFKLNDIGNLAVWSEWDHGSWCAYSGEEFSFSDANYVYDEQKAVSFGRAIGMMAEGKVMRCLWSGELFRIAEGTLQTCNDDNWQSIVKGELLEDDEMESMWMEVE